MISILANPQINHQEACDLTRRTLVPRALRNFKACCSDLDGEKSVRLEGGWFVNIWYHTTIIEHLKYVATIYVCVSKFAKTFWGRYRPIQF